MALSFSSSPGLKPTTTSALHVRKARTLTPDPEPRGPMASTNGVVGSHVALFIRKDVELGLEAYITSQLSVI